MPGACRAVEREPALLRLVRSAGPDVAAAAVEVCANSQMMDIVLDATGCPVPARLRFVADLLGTSRRPRA